jgi:hypothetical protein
MAGRLIKKFQVVYATQMFNIAVFRIAQHWAMSPEPTEPIPQHEMFVLDLF